MWAGPFSALVWGCVSNLQIKMSFLQRSLLTYTERILRKSKRYKNQVYEPQCALKVLLMQCTCFTVIESGISTTLAQVYRTVFE